MPTPINDNRGIRNKPSHGGSVYDKAIVEDEIIIGYSNKLSQPREAERWYQAACMNRTIAEGKQGTVMGATDKYVWKRKLNEAKQAVHDARVAMRREQKEAA